MILISRLRQWHAYIGLFIAPSVLFFALTGAMQIFNLHEAHGTYHPPVLLEKLSAVHKDQVFKEPPAKDDEPQSAAHAAGAPDEHPPEGEDEKLGASTLALKWFFLAVALGLFVSTLIGIWMGSTQIRRKSIAWTLMIAGTLIPIALLAL